MKLNQFGFINVRTGTSIFRFSDLLATKLPIQDNVYSKLIFCPNGLMIYKTLNGFIRL
jgi:hypothetical protein